MGRGIFIFFIYIYFISYPFLMDFFGFLKVTTVTIEHKKTKSDHDSIHRLFFALRQRAEKP